MTEWDPMELAAPDMEHLAEIFDLEDPEDRDLLKDLIEVLLETGVESIQNLIAASAEGQQEQVAGIAHQLKSSFGNVGYMQTSLLMGKIMGEARTGNGEAVTELVGAIEGGMDRLTQALRDFKDQL